MTEMLSAVMLSTYRVLPERSVSTPCGSPPTADRGDDLARGNVDHGNRVVQAVADVGPRAVRAGT